jgi:LuxR family maltose regulon positive regulatory protein
VSVLALVHVDSGELDTAEQLVGEAEQFVDKLAIGESPWATVPRLVRGKLSDRRGDTAAARTAFARAVVLARRGGRRLDLAHALLLLARLERRRDHVEARSRAREAGEILATCPDPGTLSELLATTERALQLMPLRRTATGVPADLELSDRELAVLRLLASDLSQREIGTQLYVSFNTVKAHTRSIFRKLGVTTRAEAVARSRELLPP